MVISRLCCGDSSHSSIGPLWPLNVDTSQFRSNKCTQPYESQMIIWLLPFVEHVMLASCNRKWKWFNGHLGAASGQTRQKDICIRDAPSQLLWLLRWVFPDRHFPWGRRNWIFATASPQRKGNYTHTHKIRLWNMYTWFMSYKCDYNSRNPPINLFTSKIAITPYICCTRFSFESCRVCFACTIYRTIASFPSILPSVLHRPIDRIVFDSLVRHYVCTI